MSQNTVNHSTQTIKAPFRAKSAGISLVVVLMISLYTIVNLFALLPGDEAVPDGAFAVIVTAIVLIIVLEVALHITLVIGAGQVEARTAHDEAVAARAARNAYFVLTVGAITTVGAMFAGFTPFEMGSLLLGAFLLAEIVNYASQVIYYQRPA